MSPKKQKMLQVGSSEDDDDDDDDDDIPSHDEQPDEEINNEERNDDDMEEQEESTDVQPGEEQMCKHSPSLGAFFSPKVLIIFLFLHENICCGYSLEVPR